MKPSLLIIDDSDQIRTRITDILSPTDLFKDFCEARDGIEGFKMALQQPPDLILCDLEMPGMDGFKFLSLVNTRQELRDIPLILLTGREDRESKIRCLEQGASDYITKPFDPEELIARVKVQLKIKSLQDSLRESNQRLRELSNTDALTGLSNRRSMMAFLEKEFQRSRRTNRPFSLAMVDVDHFKRVNDTYGHQEGDTVLKSLATLLQQNLRGYDLAARFGGEEFALVLPETSQEQARALAERLRLAASQLPFPQRLQKLQLTISIGVVSCPCGAVVTADDLIREADDALYAAKRLGRNRVELRP